MEKRTKTDSLVARVENDCGKARHTMTTVKCKRQVKKGKRAGSMKWRTLRNNTTNEQNIDRNCCHSSRPPTQRQASRLTMVKSVPPRMLRHHSDPQQLSHHDPHALPPNAHSRMAQPTHEQSVESQHNVSTADTLSHRFNVPRSGPENGGKDNSRHPSVPPRVKFWKHRLS